MKKLARILIFIICVLILFWGCKNFSGIKYTIDESSCIGCGRCYDACPHNAIFYNGGKAVIIQSKCKQCGLCVPVCPNDAIH